MYNLLGDYIRYNIFSDVLINVNHRLSVRKCPGWWYFPIFIVYKNVHNGCFQVTQITSSIAELKAVVGRGAVLVRGQGGAARGGRPRVSLSPSRDPPRGCPRARPPRRDLRSDVATR